MKEVNLEPILNEKPSSYADRLGSIYSKSGSVQSRKIKGQFFTPVQIAHFMASLFTTKKSRIKILDPGCGTCILSCALIESMIENKIGLKEIKLVIYETDLELIKYTKLVIAYLQKWLNKFKIKIQSEFYTHDFILENKDCFLKDTTLFDDFKIGDFDVVITNPPYFKIPKDDQRAIAARSIVYGQPNIYYIFLMVASKLLKRDGELIAIIPRSFSSGNYFREFRKAFFNEVVLNKIHLFGSRREAFNRDKILQETLIIKARKQETNGTLPKVLLTHSKGIKDINDVRGKEFKLNELIDLNSSERILHLPINKSEKNIIKIFKSWSGSFKEYEIKISTGPVVSFRASGLLFEEKRNGNIKLAPLFQLHNTSIMSFYWPVFKKAKAQYIKVSPESKSLLIPNKNYVFLRRFSAKDDKSRLVASPYFAELTKSEYIGVENHLNYIYRQNGCLEINEIFGLAALLNSSLFDTYFRTFNGNINVSATEIREIPLPPLEDIKQIGNHFLNKNNFTKSDIDKIVNSYFDPSQILIPYEKN